MLTAVPLLGEGLALACAFVWSVAVILFKKSLDAAPEASFASINLFKNTVGIALLGLTLLVLGRSIDWSRSALDWAALAVSAWLGLALADSLLFASLDRIGPGLLGVAELVAAPMQITLAALFLGESVGPSLFAGAGAVLLGLFVASHDPGALSASAITRYGPDQSRTRRQGIWLAVAAMGVMSIGVLLAKRPLEQGDLVEVTFVRLVLGNLGLYVWLRARARTPEQRRAIFLPFHHPKLRRVLFPAAAVGTYFSMLLWLGGFKYGDMAVVSVLNQMSTVFTIGLAWAILGERLTRRRAVGSAIALAGAVLIVWVRG